MENKKKKKEEEEKKKKKRKEEEQEEKKKRNKKHRNKTKNVQDAAHPSPPTQGQDRTLVGPRSELAVRALLSHWLWKDPACASPNPPQLRVVNLKRRALDQR